MLVLVYVVSLLSLSLSLDVCGCLILSGVRQHIQNFPAHEGFQLFATQTLSHGTARHENPALTGGAWMRVVIEPLPHHELTAILTHYFPSLQAVVPRLLDTFQRITTLQAVPGPEGHLLPTMRPFSTRDLFKWYVPSHRVDDVVVVRLRGGGFGSKASVELW